MLASDLADLVHQRPSGRGQVQRMQPTVDLVAAPLEIAATFQVIDEGDHPARQQSELVAQSLLAATRFDGDNAQNSGLLWIQSECRYPLGEPITGVLAELGEQKGDAGRAFSRG